MTKEFCLVEVIKPGTKYWSLEHRNLKTVGKTNGSNWAKCSSDQSYLVAWSLEHSTSEQILVPEYSATNYLVTNVSWLLKMITSDQNVVTKEIRKIIEL